MSPKAVQLWLGRHSPAFTLATYVHLLPDDLPGPTELPGFGRATQRATEATEIDRDDAPAEAAATVV